VRKCRNYFTSTCTGSCKTSEICQLRAMQSQYNCGTVTAGINLKRGEGTGHGYVKECEGSAVVPILSQLNGPGLDAFSAALLKHLGSEFLDMVISENGIRGQ
jgi:sphingomyelin phosphodiesterase